MNLYTKYIKNKIEKLKQFINTLNDKIHKIIHLPKEISNSSKRNIKNKKDKFQQSINDLKINVQNKLKETLNNFVSKNTNQFFKLPKLKFTDKVIKKVKPYYEQIIKINKIGPYRLKDLSRKEEIFLSDELSEIEINNFIHINDNTQIEIRSFAIPNNELNYLKKLTKYFKILEKHNKPYNIIIYIENRELLNQSGLLELTKNINLTIYHDFTDHITPYTKEEYLENDKQLDELIKPIKESNLTTYEKYLAVYNLVKQFKHYKDNENDPKQSRSLKYILNNEFMVCVGYADLLKTLLDKLNIPSLSISANIDTVKREAESVENVPSILIGHQRNIVKIDDDEYNIHGIYLVDPTFDNEMEYDMYAHSNMTFDKQKESNIPEELIAEELLLDFHTFEEFNEKINFYLKREISKSNKDTYQEKVVYEYLFLYYRIMEILIKLDYSEYEYMYRKYNKQIKNMIKEFENNKNHSLKSIEDLFSDFLTEYATYIIPLSNNVIDKDKLYKAASNVKKVINKYNDDEYQEWYEETKEVNEDFENLRFPYIYNPYQARINYLELKPKKLTKTK